MCICIVQPVIFFDSKSFKLKRVHKKFASKYGILYTHAVWSSTDIQPTPAK